MKKLLAVIITVIMVFGLASFAAAEYIFPADGELDGLMGKDGKSWRQVWGNTIVGEGATSDAYETYIYFTDPTSDNALVLPDESGTFVTTGSSEAITASNILNGPDGYIMISTDASSGSVGWNAHTLTGDVTGTMTNAGGIATSLEAGTDAQLMVNNATEGWAPKSMSGDITITNGLVASIGSNKVGTAEANINTVSLTVALATQWNSVAVESGSTLMGWYITTPGAVNGTTFMNSVEWDGSTFKATLSGTDGNNHTVLSGTFLRP
jgi:hypothetical protein